MRGVPPVVVYLQLAVAAGVKLAYVVGMWLFFAGVAVVNAVVLAVSATLAAGLLVVEAVVAALVAAVLCPFRLVHGVLVAKMVRAAHKPPASHDCVLRCVTRPVLHVARLVCMCVLLWVCTHTCPRLYVWSAL